MSPTIESLGILQLSAEVRLRLMGEIWDSLSDESLGEMSEAERAEIDRRLDARQANPEATAPWPDVLARLRERK